MLEVNNLVTPSPEFWNVAIRGMRNAKKSWDRSDSHIYSIVPNPIDQSFETEFYLDNEKISPEKALAFTCKDKAKIIGYSECEEYYYIGENDRDLLLTLCRAGDPSHRKVLRQLPVIMDITAPEYFWRQLDTYKVGTTSNSTSQMHTLVKEPFKLEDFSLDDLADPNYYIESGHVGIELNNYVESIIPTLNTLRDRYLETEDREFWDAILKLIPQSFNYTRTWSANYEVLVTIIKQRRTHKLQEWHDLIDYWLKHVPYLKEIVEAINESN